MGLGGSARFFPPPQTFIYLGERESASGGGAERGTEDAVGTGPDAGLELTNREITT